MMFKCKICDSSEQQLRICAKEMMFGTGLTYEYFRCAACGTLQIENPELDVSKMYPNNYYSIDGDNKVNTIKDVVKKYLYKSIVSYELGYYSLIGSIFSKIRPNMEARSLRDFINKEHRILDVGCGSGYFIEALSKIGYKNLLGVEPHIKKNITKKNFKINKGRIEDLEGNNLFDIIMLHHSFEHMNNPDLVFKSIKRLLVDDGVCVLRIPVSDCDAFEEYLENWAQLDAPRHEFLYTNKSIDFLAFKNKLKVEKIIDDSGIFQYVVSEQYRRGVPLISDESYYRPLIKKIFNKNLFTKVEMELMKQKALKSKQESRGDQRTYYLKNTH